MMNVREALEELLCQDMYLSEGYDDDARLLAPGIERALRASYHAGVTDGAGQMLDEPRNIDHHRGITAGVAAMMEEK